jgi:hypothetical protein
VFEGVPKLARVRMAAYTPTYAHDREIYDKL